MSAAEVKLVGVSVADYLTMKQLPDIDLSVDWADVAELYHNKLWHELTIKLVDFVKNPDMQKGTNVIDLYENFLVTFENKINPLSLIEIAGHVTHQYKDKREAIAFLESMEPKVKNNDQAWTFCKVLQGQLHLEHYKDMANCARIIKEVEATLQDVDGVTPVHARFYKFSLDYYRIRGPLCRYYRAGLRYVGCCQGGIRIPTVMLEMMAKTLSLAGVFAPEIYDLGELLAHPVMENLKGTKDEWVIDLVRAVAEGDVDGYKKLRNRIDPVNNSEIEKPVLITQADNYKQLRDSMNPWNYLEMEKPLFQKMSLLSLMGMAYSRTPAKRVLTFAEISEKTRVQMDEVELLVMKAMAQKLIRGFIDEVDKTVTINWVKPRALTRKQIGELADNLDQWCQVVKEAADFVEDKAGDVLTF